MRTVKEDINSFARIYFDPLIKTRRLRIELANGRPSDDCIYITSPDFDIRGYEEVNHLGGTVIGEIRHGIR